MVHCMALPLAAVECLRPLGRQAFVTAEWLLISSLAAAAYVILPNKDRPHASHEELWYRSSDFEKFRMDVIEEARLAGCHAPREQYDHIKRKFLDDQTWHNTTLNVVRTRSQSNGSESSALSGDDAAWDDAGSSTGGVGAPAAVPNELLPAPDEPAAALGTLLRKSATARRGHRRSVSFDTAFDKVLGLEPEPAPTIKSRAPPMAMSA